MPEPRRVGGRFRGGRRQQFQAVLTWQGHGTRLLALAAVAALLLGGAIWLVRGTGNLIVGILLLVFAPVLLIAVVLFLQVLQIIGGGARDRR